MKKLFLLFLFLLLSIVLFAQNQDSIVKKIPKDPLMPKWTSFEDNSFAFLVQDDVYYSFFINNIKRLKGGYFIETYTNIDSFRVRVYIVTTKNSFFLQGKKIKKGHHYYLSLRRYFEQPSIAGIEISDIHDVMLGNKIVSVASTGMFTYLFSSFNINGLNYSDSIHALKIITHYETEKNEIKQSLCQFIRAISYKQDSNILIDYVDTNQLIKSLQKYSFYIFARRPNFWKTNDPYPPRKNDLLNWEKIYKINSKQFNSLFWGMLKNNYSLPKEKTSEIVNITINDIHLDLLNYTRRKIYTVRVKWRIPTFPEEYVAIVNVKKYKGKYKIIGFNRVYRKYYH
jgi:hypothetical protein